MIFLKFVLKMHKNLPYIKFQMFGVFKSPGPVCKHLHFNLIKMHPIFFILFELCCFVFFC